MHKAEKKKQLKYRKQKTGMYLSIKCRNYKQRKNEEGETTQEISVCETVIV